MRLNYTLALAGILFLWSGSTLLAQLNRTEFKNRFQLKAAYTNVPLLIDGVLEEATWQQAQPVGDFWLKWPVAGKLAPTKTTVRAAYDDKYLYIAAMCYDSGAYIVQSLKRDAGYWESDGFAMVLDPADRTTNGYFFGLTPAGAQNEGLLSPNEDVDLNWDNIWFSEVHQTVDGWSLEMAIPFRILRYNAGQSSWGINFIRNDVSNGQYDTWTEIPLQFDGTDLGWTGQLVFETPPARAKGNYAFVPYSTVSASRDFENMERTKVKPNLGLDAKIGIGSGLNLDMTVNPDFSQVEIDEQVINLTRFDVQLPEKRTFFLENADVLGSFGLPPIRPFFSRRIGLDADDRPVPILYGLRLTGNISADTRIGLLNMHTGSSQNSQANNYSAISVRHRLFGRTTLSGYYHNRQGFDKAEIRRNDFSRNAGGEFSFTSPSGTWGSWLTYHQAFLPNTALKNAGWINTGFNYSKRRFNILVDFLRMGEHYRTDMGFETRIQNYDQQRDTVIRIPYNWMYIEGEFTFFPKNTTTSRLNFTKLGFSNFLVLNNNGTLNELNTSFSYQFNFKNTTFISTSIFRTEANVPVSFSFDDGSNADCEPLPAANYIFSSAKALWESDTRKVLGWSAECTGGEFYNGTQVGASLGLRYRVQPWGSFRFAAEYNALRFPAPYCGATLFNLTPRIEIFFNRKINWTTFIQYNTQSDNFNVNSRLQWRFRPMSDIFLVYTDNYAVQFWGPKNRALVAKVSYWW